MFFNLTNKTKSNKMDKMVHKMPNQNLKNLRNTRKFPNPTFIKVLINLICQLILNTTTNNKIVQIMKFSKILHWSNRSNLKNDYF